MVKNEIEVTRVKIFPSKKSNSGTLAYATVTINEMIVISGIRIVNGKNGLFIAMPSRRKKDEEGKNEWRDIVFPCTAPAREILQKTVLDEFDKVKEEMGFM